MIAIVLCPSLCTCANCCLDVGLSSPLRVAANRPDLCPAGRHPLQRRQEHPHTCPGGGVVVKQRHRRL